MPSHTIPIPAHIQDDADKRVSFISDPLPAPAAVRGGSRAPDPARLVARPNTFYFLDYLLLYTGGSAAWAQAYSDATERKVTLWLFAIAVLLVASITAYQVRRRPLPRDETPSRIARRVLSDKCGACAHHLAVASAARAGRRRCGACGAEWNAQAWAARFPAIVQQIAATDRPQAAPPGRATLVDDNDRAVPLFAGLSDRVFAAAMAQAEHDATAKSGDILRFNPAGVALGVALLVWAILGRPAEEPAQSPTTAFILISIALPGLIRALLVRYALRESAPSRTAALVSIAARASLEARECPCCQSSLFPNVTPTSGRTGCRTCGSEWPVHRFPLGLTKPPRRIGDAEAAADASDAPVADSIDSRPSGSLPSAATPVPLDAMPAASLPLNPQAALRTPSLIGTTQPALDDRGNLIHIRPDADDRAPTPSLQPDSIIPHAPTLARRPRRKRRREESSQVFGLWFLAGIFFLGAVAAANDFLARQLHLRYPLPIAFLACLAAFAAGYLWLRSRAPKGPLFERVHLPHRLVPGRCGACNYPIHNIPPAADGLHECPECGAAWNLDLWKKRYPAGAPSAIAERERLTAAAGKRPHITDGRGLDLPLLALRARQEAFTVFDSAMAHARRKLTRIAIGVQSGLGALFLALFLLFRDGLSTTPQTRYNLWILVAVLWLLGFLITILILRVRRLAENTSMGDSARARLAADYRSRALCPCCESALTDLASPDGLLTCPRCGSAW